MDRLRGHRHCILLDHRGIGESDRWVGHYSFDLWARDAVELLDHLGVAVAPVLGLCPGDLADRTLGFLARCEGSQVLVP